MSFERVFLIVLDSFGIGEMPDAGDFGDIGSHTLRSIASSGKYDTPHLKKLGLFNIEGVNCGTADETPIGSFGRMAEASKGKDTTIGHWEIAGLISKEPLPTYPQGFPDEILTPLVQATGRGVLCNLPYSGTDVIRDFGKEHVETGKMIVYTSADSVFQIAAHESIIPIEELYSICRQARELLQGKHGVGRVIARPFEGTFPDFQRTRNRHDFSLEPPGATMLDALTQNGYDTVGIGKIYDIFAGKGIQTTSSMQNNADGMNQAIKWLERKFKGLCFVNLVDFDMLYGHRLDVDGYAQAATDFDQQLGQFITGMKPSDLLLITADHGCDPGKKDSTDHTREYTPLLAYGAKVKKGHSIGTKPTFADIAATIVDVFGIHNSTDGSSFLNEILI